MATAPKILPGKLFINGEWREASDGERRDVINPATGTVVSSIAWATAADVDAAAATAVIMEGATAMQPENMLILDRPFLFFIRDVETGQILFIGRVLNPQ